MKVLDLQPGVTLQGARVFSQSQNDTSRDLAAKQHPLPR